MSLKQRLHKGDWVRAEASGTVIEGQAAHDMERAGSATLLVKVADQVIIPVNVNRWDVSVVRENLIPYPEETW